MAVQSRTLKFKQLGDLFLIVHAPRDPDPDEWRALIEESHATARRLRLCLVYSENVKLQPKQRGDLADIVKAYPIKVAVLADSPVARGVVTALGWITGKYRGFSSSDIEGALAYLGAHVPTSKLRDEIAALRKELQAAHTAAG